MKNRSTIDNFLPGLCTEYTKDLGIACIGVNGTLPLTFARAAGHTIVLRSSNMAVYSNRADELTKNERPRTPQIGNFKHPSHDKSALFRKQSNFV